MQQGEFISVADLRRVLKGLETTADRWIERDIHWDQAHGILRAVDALKAAFPELKED